MNKTILIIIIGIILIYYLYMSLVLFKLFQKDNINKYYALIPIYHLYLIFNICKLPFITLLIPLANIIVLICLPYRICKQYGVNKLHSYISILLPIPMLIYLGFSKHTNKDIKYNPNFLKTIEDVNDLENKLVKDTDYILDDSEDIIINKEPESHINSFVENIESTIINDDIVYEDEPVIKEKFNNQDDEILDLNVSSINSIDDLSKIEQDMELTASKNNQDTKDESKEYSNDYTTSDTIAFGGKEKIENKTHAKNDELKCPRCGSSLVGSYNNICPGCGAPINKE